MQVALLLTIGLTAGILGGLFGIGGGVIMVPALLYLLKADQLTANGTSLAAQVLPVGLLGAVEYYRHGHVEVKWALLIAVAFFIGAYFGARFSLGLPVDWMRRGYAVFLVAVGLRMLFSRM